MNKSNDQSEGRKLKITWNKNVRKKHRKEIEKYLIPFLWLVPGWCQELVIGLWNADEGAAIRTSIRYEYRRAEMDFYASWLISTERMKGVHVVHDLLHIPTSIYVDWAEATLYRLVPEQDQAAFHAQLKGESLQYCESMVQDLAVAIYEKFGVRETR